MMQFSTFGQMNIDLIFDGITSLPEQGEEVFASNFDLQLGGGPMVCPIILNQLGVKSQLGTFLGQDMLSDLARNLLSKMNFNDYTNFNAIEKNPVVVTSVLSLEKDRSFICYNENVREDQITDEIVYDFLKDSKVVFAPIGKLNVLRRLKQRGIKIIFDTGWDDDLHIDMFKEMLKYVDVFTPNHKEAMKMTDTSTIEEAVIELAKYVKYPVISNGDKGCITYINNEIIRVEMPVDFEVVDTTGAGDNFLTGIAYGLIHEKDIITCMKYGNIFGGYSTQGLGCYKSSITLEAIDDLMALY
ncbi:carbohydrate kinase family protein [Acidaminobacter sp. JC074]|uniref:carbohydrate kinase family protein n=1 Tax=Acidaminobacter sp. JC074 TaxID=2530199 RepID=UPI001F0F676D|nr:carbohydrate kinase family protein [Acidaminobacter sp. JC074]MCH4888981.1 carbohydrate kinase family protein [Acidaminobacter sp. JC074]